MSENKTRLKTDGSEMYWYLEKVVAGTYDREDRQDNNNWSSGNYFKTRKEAEDYLWEVKK